MMKQPKILLIAALIVVAVGTTLGITLTGSSSPSTFYSVYTSEAAYRAAGQNISLIGDTDAIAMNGSNGTFSLTLGGAGHSAILSFWPDTSAAQSAERSYSVIPHSPGGLERIGNVVIAWDQTPSSSDEFDMRSGLRAEPKQ